MHHLEYIVEIARQNNISKAAEILHVSQPTLSIYLNRLEKELNLKLFIRKNNILTITPSGQRYVDTAVKILRLRDHLYGELYSGARKELRVGILFSDAALLRKPLLAFQDRYPDISIRPEIGNSEKLYQLVLSGELDFAYVTSYLEDYRKLYQNVNCSIVKNYELVIFLSRQNPLFQKLHLEAGTISVEELPLFNALNFCVASGVPMIRQRILNELLPTMGLTPRIFCDINNLDFLTTTLCLENQYSIMPFSYTAQEDFAMILLPSHPKIYKILIKPKNKRMSSAEQSFVRLVQKEFDQNPYYYYLR